MKDIDQDLISDKWYRVERTSGVVYSPFKVTKTEFFCLHDDRLPTPAEIVETLKKYKSCMYLGDGFFEREVEDDDSNAESELSPGIYRHVPPNSGREGLVPFELRDDVYVPLGTACAEIVTDIKNFRANEDFYKDIGAMHKLGVLLYGDPGNSKTTTIREILRSVEKDDAVVIFINEGLPTLEFLECMKASLGSILKVFIFEELTTNMNDYRFVEKMLNFLDGESSLDGMIVLATTNYPEKLPGNLADRPSRFDKLIKFENPNDEERMKLLTHFMKQPATPEEVVKTKGLSIAQLKEVVMLMKIDKLTFLEALAKIKARKKKVKDAFLESKGSVGFGGSYDD